MKFSYENASTKQYYYTNLEQFKFKMVLDACIERERLLKNAPHLVKPLPFILPLPYLLPSPLPKYVPLPYNYPYL